jgi:hypothetical protein
MIAMTIAITLAVSGLCIPLTAQWLNYPTPGIPRTPDGKPNLVAPAPRTAGQGWEAMIATSRET